MRRILAVAAGLVLAALAVAGCASTGPSPACKAALSNERAVVGGNNALVAKLGTTTILVPGMWAKDKAAIARASAAGCPGDAKILMPD